MRYINIKYYYYYYYYYYYLGSKFKMIQGTTPFVGFSIGTLMVIWITS